MIGASREQVTQVAEVLRELGQHVSPKLPPWFKRIFGQHNIDWLDHVYRRNGTETVLIQPYTLGLSDMKHIAEVCEKYHLDITVSGSSFYFPGRTVNISLKPTAATYALLKLKSPKLNKGEV